MQVELTNKISDSKSGESTGSPDVDNIVRNVNGNRNHTSESNLKEQYSGINWHSAIFLPFDGFFANVVILSVIVVIVLIIYKIAYSIDQTMTVPEYYIIPFCDVIYLIDAFLRAAHNLLKKVQETREYLPTNWFSLIVDTISLIPFNLIYNIWVMNKGPSGEAIYSILSSNKLLRIYRLPLNYLQLGSAMGARNSWHLITGYVAIYLVFGHILAAILHTLACWGCSDLNWTHSFPPEVLDHSEKLHQFLAAITVTLSLNWNNARRNISAVVPKEWCFFSIAMVTGFFMKSMFYAFLVSTFRRNMWRQISFMLKIKCEAEFVKSWGTPRYLRAQLDLYHLTLLKNRAAIKTRPKFFHTLPGPLKRSVQLDLHWEMLRHSQLFQNQDIAFKRALSCTMRIQYFLPGEYVFRVNRFTSKMIYITSGVLQVLTEDDAETPILSLSSGTILGEGALLMPSKCRADIRCATHCILHILDATSLYRLLHLYPEVAAHLHEKRGVRSLVAQNLNRLRHNQIRIGNNVRYNDGISWLKTQWHAIESTVKTGNDDDVLFDSIPIDGTRTSRHVELLALSEKVELMSNAVCLTMNCPCILEPESNFLNWWGKFITFLSVIVVTFYPYYIAFTYYFPNWLLIFDTIFVLTKIIDIFIQASTAVKLPSQLMIVDIEHLLRLRLQRIIFIIDIIIALPVELFVSTFQTDSKSTKFSYYSSSAYRLNRLLTVHKLYKYILELEKNFGINAEPVKIYKSILTYTVAVYWLAAGVYFMSCRMHGCGVDSWIGYYSKLAAAYDKQEFFENPIIVTMFNAFNTLTSLGVTTLVPRNRWEILELDAGIIFSVIMYVHFCSELGATRIIYNESKNEATEHLKIVTKFLELHGNSTDIITRVRNHLCTQWEYNKLTRNVEGKLMTMASQDLYDKIIIHSMIQTLKAAPIFHTGDETFLEILAVKAKVFLLTKDTTIARAGLKTTAVYVIRNGYCQIISALPSDVDRDRTEVIGPGSMILVTEFLHNTNNLADIHTITTCEIISIEDSEFWNALNMFPELKAQYNNAIDYHYFTGKTIVSTKDGRTSGKTDGYDNLDTLDEKVVLLQYLTPFESIGVFSVVRYLMLHQGINQHGRNFGYWEKFREVICILSAIFYPQFFTSLVAYPGTRFIGYIFDIVGFIDIYLRLHISYYNTNGILVTHPLWTAKHYLTSSFAIDVIMSMPLELLGLQNTFGSGKAQSTKAWFYLITRPLLLFRVFGRFAIMKNDIQHGHKSLAHFKFLLTIGVMLNALSCANMLHICEFRYNEGLYEEVQCTSVTWFSQSEFKENKNPLAIYCLSVYYFTTFVFCCGNGVISVASTVEMISSMLICVTVLPMWWLMIAQITCNKIGGDLTLTGYRQEMQSLLRYMKNEDVATELISQTIEEMEHRWKCSEESDWKKLFKTLPSQLYEEVAMSLHGETLIRANLFKDQDSGVTRLLACQVDDTCFRKGTTIIRRNEVQGNIYIIQNGLVDILAADDTLICTLGAGGIFGSFRRKKPVRHMMQMMAQSHVLLFVIPADKFYRIIDRFPVIQARLSNATVMNAEFIDSQTIRPSIEKSEREAELQKKTHHKLIIISEESTWYKWFQWILCFPVSMISIYLVTSQIALQALNVYVSSSIYICDFFFLVKIYFGFHTNFTEETSGTIVDDYKQIRRRYFHTWNLFWLDLLCCIPFEVIAYTRSESRVQAQLLTVLKLNRLLRLFHTFNFQAKNHRKLYINPLKISVFLCTTNLLFVHLGVCLWIFVACRESGCRHKIPPNRENLFVTARFKAMQLAYQYNFDLLTSVGIQDIGPATVPEVLTTTFLIIIYQIMSLNILTTLATLIHLSQHMFTNFEIQAGRLYSFMKSRSLSSILLQRIWEYCLQQWVRQRGAWMPNMILSTPNFLQHQIMFDIYGYLLVESELFHGLHEDFLIQLTARMKRCVYFPKNYIVQAGDVDHTMYFIHSGEVKILCESHVKLQGPGSILGVKQGVTYALPHFNDVIALTVTDIMSLHKNAWKDLLAEFPSAGIILSKRISRLSEYC